MAAKIGVRNFTGRRSRAGRRKGSTVAATAIRDVQIMRLRATGMSLTRVAEVFGVTKQTIINAQWRQRKHFIMQKREAREREEQLARRKAARRAGK